MEEEFSVTLEDDSERQVAEDIFKMYEECFNGNPTFARQFVAHAEGAIALNNQFPVKVQTTEHDDDDDEEMTDGPPSIPLSTSVQQENSAALPFIPLSYSNQPLFGTTVKKLSAVTEPVRQLGESIQEEPVVDIDEDGFAPVQAKGRRRR
jgi:hypothetical protein